jgi:hypothetical protein
MNSGYLLLDQLKAKGADLSNEKIVAHRAIVDLSHHQPKRQDCCKTFK